jgi:hypothetical protein
MISDHASSDATTEPSFDLINEKDFARRLGVCVSWPRKQRVRGDGPPYYVIGAGRHIRYRWSEVLAWLETRKRQSTSQTLVERQAAKALRGSHRVTATNQEGT